MTLYGCDRWTPYFSGVSTEVKKANVTRVRKFLPKAGLH